MAPSTIHFCVGDDVFEQRCRKAKAFWEGLRGRSAHCVLSPTDQTNAPRAGAWRLSPGRVSFPELSVQFVLRMASVAPCALGRRDIGGISKLLQSVPAGAMRHQQHQRGACAPGFTGTDSKDQVRRLRRDQSNRENQNSRLPGLPLIMPII